MKRTLKEFPFRGARLGCVCGNDGKNDSVGAS